MKKFRLFAGSLLLAGALFGCIENEEAEGIKALREAQAALINAKAANETTLANAEAAFVQAQAKIEEAKALQAAAQARYQELQNDLREAQNTDQIARLEADLELFQVEKQGEIAAAQLEAEVLLNSAKMDLEASIRALKAEIAISAVATPALDEYLTKYTEAVNEVTSLQARIISKNAEIATAEYYNSDDDLMNLKLTQKDRLTREKALAETWKLRYEDLVGERVSREDALLDVTEILADLEYQYLQTETEMEKQAYLKEKAYSEYTRTYDEYSVAVNTVETIANLTDGPNSFYSIPRSFLEVYENYPTPVAGNENFRTVSYYQSGISDLEEDITGYSAVLRKVEALKRLYATRLAQLEAAIPAAEVLVFSKQHDLNVAQLRYDADQTTANQTALDAAQDAYDDAVVAYNNAVTAYNDFKAEIDSSYLVGTEPQYNAALVGWISGSNNVEGIDALIDWYNNKIADLNADKDAYQAELAVVEAYIAYLNETDVDRIPELKVAYFSARAAYWEANKKYNDLAVELGYITNERNIAEDYMLATQAEYVVIENSLDDLTDTIHQMEADIAMIEKDFSSWDAYKEMLQRELTVLEDELNVYQKKAEKYYALVNAELDGTNGETEAAE